MKFFLIISASIAVSVACSTSRSASSPAVATDNVLSSQSSTATSSYVPQESSCTLKIAQAPVIKGLKLGMTPDEILALFPGSKDDAELRTQLSRPPRALGNSSFLIRPEKYGSKAEYVGLSQITVSLLDGHASSFNIGYKGPQWRHVDEFVSKFVEGTNLPSVDQWQAYSGLDDQMKTLTCTGFSIRVFAGGEGGNLNYVLLQDLEADTKLKERRKKAAEEASPTPGGEQ